MQLFSKCIENTGTWPQKTDWVLKLAQASVTYQVM